MMKHDLSKATFIIPVRIESDDRMTNVFTILSFLQHNFDTNIIVKEVGPYPKDEYGNEIKISPVMMVLNRLRREYPNNKEILKNITHIFEHSEEGLFHRQKILNEMVMETKTEIVVNYDADVVFPVESYVQAYDMILNKGSDVVYPYGTGACQRKVHKTENKNLNLYLGFVNGKEGNQVPDYSVLDRYCEIGTSDFGWAQFFKRSVYIEGGLENENFKAYAPEDKERHYRFKTLGYKVDRIKDGLIYHFEHDRGENSWIDNPYFVDNKRLWDKLRRMDKEQLKEYYSQQEYLKKYVSL